MSTKSVRFVVVLAVMVIFIGNSGVAGAERAAAANTDAHTPLIDHPLTNASLLAAELHVCKTGGADFTTIQAAVDAAQIGDVIKVAAATYTESKPPYNLYIDKTVSILGGYTCANFTNQNPTANVTTIHPFTIEQSVVSIQGVFGNTPQVAPMLDGFTISGGGGGNHGGGISLRDSDATISNNVISGNIGFLFGGGIWAQRGAARIQYNRIQNNTTDTLGGGIALENSTASVLSNIIANNTLTDADFTNGGGVDISSGGGPVLLANNTIVNNTVNGVHAGSNLTLVNNIIKDHAVGVTTTATVTSTYNTYFGNTTNNVNFALTGTDLIVDPQLTADFHLNAGSPAIDAGTHTNAPNRDIDRQPRAMIGTSGIYKIDIGADEFTGVAQTNRELATQPADFTLIGPGNPQENPDSTGSNDWIGYAAWGGDISGDNRADLIAGAPNLSEEFNGGPNDSGRVFALYNNGTRRLGAIDLYTTTPSLEVRSYLNQQHIGQAFATADLNGDGARDLIIGATGASNFDIKGTVFVFQGGVGLSGTKTLFPTMQAAWRFRSGEDTSTFGGQNSLAAGKLNNDGIDDLVVAEGFATGPGGRLEAGAVFVFFGGGSLPALWDLGTTPASLTIYGPATDSSLNRVAIADVNGDGKSDLVARSSSNAYVFYGPLPSGTIDLAVTPADATITGLDGDWLAAGDVDGDGKTDIILGRTSEVDVVRGGTLGVSQTIGAAASARFTNFAPTTLHAFDWSGDGKADVVLGDTMNNRPVVVIFGGALSGAADALDRAGWIITGEVSGDKFGYSISSGDLDADGGADLIIGSRSHSVTNHSPNFEDAGAVYVFYGTAPTGKIYLPFISR